MNLLSDSFKWIPVTHQSRFTHISLKDLLCRDEDWQISLNRDDMELAALQLAICLVQVVFMPHDGKELKRRMETPLTEEEYKKGIAAFPDMFVLDHPKHPFMQTRGVEGKEVSLQKFFIGLPEKASTSPYAHAFFNEVDEVEKACPSCAVIALFQQATNGVSLGGSPFPVGLKGMSPVTTLVFYQNLRKRIWGNILSKEFLSRKKLYSAKPADNKPTWKSPIRLNGKKAEAAHIIGLIRGLFWQPSRVELRKSTGNEVVCDSCGVKVTAYFTGFCQEPSPYIREGFWRHPHSPVDVVQKSYFKFWSQVPTWANLSQFFWEKKSSDEGHSPALVITQHNEIWPGNPISISIGGYVSSKEKVEARRHEIYSLPAGWENNMANIENLILTAIKTKDILWATLFDLGTMKGPSDIPPLFTKPKRKNKPHPVLGLANSATELFLQLVEPEVHSILRKIHWKEAESVRTSLKARLITIADEAFSHAVEPHQHNIRAVPKIVVKREELKTVLNSI
jgi:CRISPR system Cascade subunit CasA